MIIKIKIEAKLNSPVQIREKESQILLETIFPIDEIPIFIRAKAGLELEAIYKKTLIKGTCAISFMPKGEVANWIIN